MIETAQALQLLFPKATQEEHQKLQGVFLNSSNVIEAPADTPLFSPGDSCKNYLFLLEGQVRVFSTSANGREILLYRIKPGDTCILSTNCMMGSQFYPASAKTETPCIALSIPVECLQNAIKESSLLNQFLMDNFSRRIGCLIELVSEVAMERLDVRLARHLLKLSNENQEVYTTHEDLAKEIGTAREVVSRQLRQFEKSEWVKTSRGLIRILQVQILDDLSEGFFN